MIYTVPKKDQYDDLKYFMFSFSAPDSLLPYALIITRDFESLKYFSIKNLVAVARRLEIEYTNMTQQELITEIKSRIVFE